MMNLRNLPLDTQRCTLLIGSFAYDAEETIYEWNTKDALHIQNDVIMNQFSLIDARVGKEILIRDNRKYTIFSFELLLASRYIEMHSRIIFMSLFFR